MEDYREDTQAADFYGGIPYACMGRDRCGLGRGEADARQGWGLVAPWPVLGEFMLDLRRWNWDLAGGTAGSLRGWFLMKSKPMVDVCGGTGSWLEEWPRHERTLQSYEWTGRRAPPPGRSTSEQ